MRKGERASIIQFPVPLHSGISRTPVRDGDNILYLPGHTNQEVAAEPQTSSVWQEMCERGMSYTGDLFIVSSGLQNWKDGIRMDKILLPQDLMPVLRSVESIGISVGQISQIITEALSLQDDCSTDIPAKFFSQKYGVLDPLSNIKPKLDAFPATFYKYYKVCARAPEVQKAPRNTMWVALQGILNESFTLVEAGTKLFSQSEPV